MSLLGSLEDLSLPDIVQIVYLSRRTGILEIVDGDARWCVYFRQGQVVGADSPETDSSLGLWLASKKLITSEEAAGVADAEIPGVTLLDEGTISAGVLGKAIRHRVVEIVSQLRDKRTGEFNFLLSEDLKPSDLGYDPEQILEGGGIPPAEAMEGSEQLKPLQGLEESLRAGKALLRGEAEPEQASAIGFGKEIAEISRESREMPLPASEELPDEEEEFSVTDDEDPFETAIDVAEAAPLEEEEAPFEELSAPDLEVPGPAVPQLDEADSSPFEVPRVPEVPDVPEAPGSAIAPEPPRRIADATPPPPKPSRVRIEAGAAVEESDRNVVIFERDPLVRVAAKRAFGDTPFSLFQYGSVDDTRKEVDMLLNASRFFVTFLNTDDSGSSSRLLSLIKKKNRHLPVVMIDRETDLDRRHDLLRRGADLYLTKPSAAHLKPAIADESLSRFADELVGFVERSATEWLDLTRTIQTSSSANLEVGEAFYQIAERERAQRSRDLIRYLIDELTDPDDISQVADTVLRMAEEYLDRAILFVMAPTRFIGLGGFGSTGDQREMAELSRRIWIPRDYDSVLRKVSKSGEPHRGKMRRTDANAKLLEGMGNLLPSEVIVIPIRHDGTTEGILFGDNASQRVSIGDTRALELFLAESGLAFRNAVIANAKKKGIDWDDQ